MPSRRAVIIGGSMSGLFAAAFLRRVGWSVDVFERSPVELVGRGAGITTHPELLDALEASGAGTRDLGIEVVRRIAIDRSGRIIAERRLPQILTSWDRLQHLLRQTIEPKRYHLGQTFTRAEQHGTGVRAHFADGSTQDADLLVGGDGIRSGVRGQLAPQVQPIYAGYYIWRGAPNEADLAPQTHRDMFRNFVFYLPPRQQIIGYPISGLDTDLREGRRRYNFIWYRVADARELAEMCVDEDGHRHLFSVPPPLIRKDLIARMRAEAQDILPAGFLDCLTHIARPFFTPIYDFASPRIVFGRVALVGDAAASARPHMGFGVAKAGADAKALADALRDRDDIDAALADYDAVRRPIGERIVRHGRRLGTHLGVDLKSDDDRRMFELLQDPGAMMDHIAVPNFLAT